jgi:thiol:disulfide interchange protein
MKLRSWRTLQFLFGLLLATASVGWAAGNAPASVQAPHLKVSLVSEVTAVEPGMPAHLGLLFDLEQGWHVYWLNAGDSGEPPSVKWMLPAGFSAGALEFPAPKRLPLGPLMDFGYEHQVLLPTKLTVEQQAKGGFVGADVTWLVCRQSCIPGKAHLGLTLPSGTTALSPAAPLFASTLSALPRPLPSNARAAFQPSPQGLSLAITGLSGVANAQFFPAEQSVIANAAPQPVSAVGGGSVIDLKKEDGAKTPAALKGLLVLANGTAYLVDAAPGALPAAAAGSTSGGWIRYVGLAFLGGLILNLMPCVFPVLFIKALALVQSSTAERRRMRLQGIAYTVGILVSFWVVVAVLLVLRAGGRQLGWGFQFQSPTFIALIALLLFFFALSLAGMFEVGLSVTSAGSSLANQHGYAGSFFTGVLAMVVATPCTAPFMGPAIGFALTQTAAVTFAVFTGVGIGLALPYLLLAFEPAWTRLLPRPGAWMEVLKQATAVPIFATVIWMVWLFAQSAGVNALIALLAGFLLLAIAGWVLGRWPAELPATLTAIAIVALAVAAPLYGVHTLSTTTAQGSSTRGWQPFTPQLVAMYQAQGRPVFVDFTADWCLSCQVNERVVLRRPEVMDRLRDGKIALVRADWTRRDEDIARALAALGRSGVPAYALYPGTPGGAPQVLPEVLTPGLVLDALKAVEGSGSPSNTAVLHPPR